MKFWRLLTGILFCLLVYLEFAKPVLGASCTGFGECCLLVGYCSIDGYDYECYDPGDRCGPGTANLGTCSFSYQLCEYVGCSGGDCVANSCPCGTWYLGRFITACKTMYEDLCHLQCDYSDQGCGAYGCPDDTRRVCSDCGSGWSCQCVSDASCQESCTPYDAVCDDCSASCGISKRTISAWRQEIGRLGIQLSSSRWGLSRSV